MAKRDTERGPVIPPGRIKLRALHVTIDHKTYQIVHMSIADVLVAGAPDWFAPRQKVEFSFILTLPAGERVLPTYGIVLRNGPDGLEMRYTPPSLQWRDILTRLIQDEMRAG
jgi:hypothetical protein